MTCTLMLFDLSLHRKGTEPGNMIAEDLIYFLCLFSILFSGGIAIAFRARREELISQ
ncbi:hypothetical protein IQ258_29395 [Coleofasciculus sp. LEGE 07081]|uniref:hypothetical protein n=1 Tax=Coleofasciculus sp. LEGE 07081 TaxID=2777967 RepID=UPI001881AFC0|nr:hypothetical protein [Coleofasciculus sp. LEGE 07081]MBE9130135.1 hypothetical protein [Coleofasciculus sp. LEGE 07081]